MTEPAASNPDKLRVLLVTRNLPPLTGGMEKLNLYLVRELAQEFAVAVVGPPGCGVHLPSGAHAREVASKPVWKFLVGAFSGAATLARRFRPHCVVAGSGLTAPVALLAARTCGAKTVVYVHGLDLVAQNRIYRAFWLPFLRRMDLCIANSHNTARLAASIGISQERILVIHPGVEVPPQPHPQAGADFREAHGLTGKRVLLSVGRMTRRKGLLEFVDRALPALVEAHPDTVLVVIGNEAPDALLGSGEVTSARLLELAAAKNLEHSMRILGQCDDAMLASAWRAADLHVFPVRPVKGDVEGFGMVAIEAAAHGLPTLAFSVGGVVDAVADGISGWLVPPDDYPSLVSRALDLLGDERNAAVSVRCREFAKRFAWPRFGRQMRAALLDLVASP